MKLIQLYKFFILVFILCSTIYPKAIKPNGKENMLKLVVETKEGNKIRPYYVIDKSGLTYSDFKGFKIGDKISFQIMSRTHMASNSNSSKKYQFELIIMDGSKELLRRDLNYNKKTADVTSPEKKGFYFSHAGYWFEDIKLTKGLKVILNSKIKGQKIYVRLLANSSNEFSKSDSFMRPLDSQKNIIVEYLKNDKNIRSKGWFLVSEGNKQEFMIPSNSLVRVFCRSVIDDKNNDSDYTVKVHENGQWIGNYMFDKIITENNAKIITDYKKMENLPLSKTRSFYLSVPKVQDVNYSYYSFSVPDGLSDSDKMLIKIVEYEISNN